MEGRKLTLRHEKEHEENALKNIKDVITTKNVFTDRNKLKRTHERKK